MHLSKVITLSGLAATTALAETESVCGGLSTVYLTVTAPPITETSYTSTSTTSVPIAPESSVAISQSLVEAPTKSEATLTSFQTLTSLVSIVKATATSPEADQGPYSFAEHSGTTVWLGGKEPPASESIVVKTKAITVHPVPLSAYVSTLEASHTKSYTTVFLTSTASKVFTETLTESISAAVASAKPFTGVAAYGWNSSLTTLVKIAAGEKESGRVYRTAYTPSVAEQQNRPIGTAHPLAGPQSISNVSETLAERQVGAIVVVTIEGQVVSWTNSYNGVPATSSAVAQTSATGVDAARPSIEPTSTLGAYVWESIPLSNPAQSTVSLVSLQTSALTPASTSTTASASMVLSMPSFETQPANSSPQPTFVASGMSNVPQPVPHSTVIASSALYLNTSSTSNVALAPTSTCSDAARFTVDFDDLPHFSTGPNDVDVPPIFNPYRKLYWEEHFGYVPPPTDPFLPVSPPQLAIYRVDNNTNVDGSPDAGNESIGEFGAGPRSKESAYWIDAFSVYLGCSNAGPDNCVITINGYEAASSTRAVFQTVTQPPCPGLKNCSLTHIEFNAGFRNLSGIQILAAVERRPVTWYMDDLQLGWSNTSCAAATERASAE